MKMKNETEILKVEQELYDKLWLMRHLILKDDNKDDLEKFYETHSSKKEQEIRNKIKADEMLKIEMNDLFYMGKIMGELSAVRWVLGHEWDMLDT
jgi:hypothetical protein